LSEAAREEISKANLDEKQRLLAEIAANGKLSIADYATRCGFLHKGGPNKRKTFVLLRRLKAMKLIEGEPGDYTVTVKAERKAKGKSGTPSGTTAGSGETLL
jgi:hypothetical protein